MFFNLTANNILPKGDCLLCLAPIDHNCAETQIICSHCQSRLALLNRACPVCALPMVSKQEQSCGECLKQSPPYYKTVAAFHYEPPVSNFISQLKFNAQRHLLPLLTHHMIAAIRKSYLSDSLPQELIPVPLFPKKLKQRGFNQAQLIAKRLAREFAITLNYQSVIRTRQTRAQVGLDAINRQRNLRNAFAIKAETANHVAIIDDVMTTGTTVSELSNHLIRKGCKRIDVWCLARAYSI